MNPHHAHPHIVIPGGALALDPQADLGFAGASGIGPDEVEGDFSQQREILGRMVLAQGTGILTEIDIEHPVKPGFDAPMRPDRLRQFIRAELAGADVVTQFDGRGVAQVLLLPHRIDSGDRLALGQSRWINDAWRGQAAPRLSFHGALP